MKVESRKPDRRGFIKNMIGMGGGAMALSASCSGGGNGAGTGKQPNILLITSDQQRKDSLGVYDPRSVHTQHLDALAADGVTFNRAYIAAPTCTPSRSSILTGQYPSRHGAYVIGTRLDQNALKVTDILAADGYETYAVGKMHFQQVSTEGSFEGPPQKFDEEFWREFDGPYYGFQHTRLLNQHSSEHHACRMAYGVWLKDKGLTEEDIARYFDGRRQATWDLPRALHSSVFVSEKSADFIRDHAANRHDQPFFMWASFPDPHAPHVVQKPYDTLYDPDKVALTPYREGELDNKPQVYRTVFDNGSRGHPNIKTAKNEPEAYWREKVVLHHGMVALMDEEIGVILDTLKQTGMYDDTVIIFTSDHGDYLGNHGFWSKGFASYDEVFNVPYIVKNVGGQKQGTRTDAITSLVDIAPTILEAAGLQVPAAMQGASQLPLVQGSAEKIRDSLLIENREDSKGQFYQKMLVTDQHKLVYYHGDTEGELYDMQQDPDQYDNLWENQKQRSLKQKLLGKLTGEYTENGSVPDGGSTTENLLEALDAQIAAEGQVQERTSGS